MVRKRSYASDDDKSFQSDDSEMEWDAVPTPRSSTQELDQGLPFRPAPNISSSDVRIELHPSPKRDGILVSVVPSQKPQAEIKHVPCDIVLTIDVSGSMSREAPAPVANPNEVEKNGLTVLDLTKHAARTIVETLDETDRLGLVTFSTDAEVVQQLLPMTKRNKDATLAAIESLKPKTMTNLWHGIIESIKLFDDSQRPSCVSAILVLTDGMPNHMCPRQGYIPKIRSYKIPGSIHTFGFGYSLQSGLLKSIAEVGGGNYAFIPDSGMLGTVFVHAVANLQSTFATNATVSLTCTKGLKLLEATGACVKSEVSYADSHAIGDLTLHLDNLQYGQSRDIFLRYDEGTFKGCQHNIRAVLHCNPLLDLPANETIAECNTEALSTISPELFAYHCNRSKICSVLSSIFPLNKSEEHQVTPDTGIRGFFDTVEILAKEFKENNYQDEFNLSLLEDLAGEDPSGQIGLALSSVEYFNKWGRHYLLSLLNAHQKQICNSFKDPGPLQYGKDSPLFIQCRDALDFAFDSLPPPKPSIQVKKPVKVDMRKYHRKDIPCFAGECQIRMSDGNTKLMKELRKESRVWTPAGTRTVAAVVATKVRQFEMCVIGELVITPWHPICTTGQWTFPNDATTKRIFYTGYIYSILLDRCRDPNTHAVNVGNCLVVTLGHGITRSDSGDIRAHAFLGDHRKVERSVQSLRAGSSGVLLSGGLIRDNSTGLACGFKPTVSASSRHGLRYGNIKSASRSTIRCKE